MELSELGLTKEVIEDRVVSTIVNRLLLSESFDDEGCSYPRESDFAKQIEAKISEAVVNKVESISADLIEPKVGEIIENLTLQKTNEWGEKKGEAVTFIEFMVNQANEYMEQPVDSSGKPDESRFNRSAKRTRLAHMIDQYLASSVERAMGEVIKAGNDSLAGALAETCKAEVKRIAQNLKISVNAKTS